MSVEIIEVGAMMPTVAADYCTQLMDLLDTARRGLQLLQARIDTEGLDSGLGQFNNATIMGHLQQVHVRVTQVLGVLVQKDVIEDTADIPKQPPCDFDDEGDAA